MEIAHRNNWLLLSLDNKDNLELAKHIDKSKQYLYCDAVSCIFQNQIIIFYKPQPNIGRLNFTIAHEFGHIVLSHLKNLSKSEYEREANMFAARILMPACVLLECGVTTPQTISELCDTSLSASKFRALRMEILKKRDKFYTSKLEKKVVLNFEEFIQENK